MDSAHGERFMMTGKLAALSVLILCAGCAGRGLIPTRPGTTPSPSPRPPSTPTPTPEPKRLSICLASEPDSLYYYGTEDVAAQHVWQGLYDGPVDIVDYRYQPVILSELPTLGAGATVQTTTVRIGDRVLAASGSVMELAPGVTVRDQHGRQTTFHGEAMTMERMVVTFTLRSDIRWSDGTRLTADDSVFSFELAADAATPVDKYLVERTADYRATGEFALTWQGVPGFIDGAYALNLWHPLPRHAWGHLSASELLTSEEATRLPLGWGPFAIVSWKAGGPLIMDRNPFYFRAPEGLPRVDEVAFHFVSDVQALGDGLLAGTCDVATHEAGANLDGGQLTAANSIRAISSRDRWWELLAFGITPAADHERPDFFEDVRVRQAIAQCVDREGVTAEALGDEGRVVHSYVPPEHPAYGHGALTRWLHNPEAAELLFAEAGWYDEDGDGIREAHGIPGIADGTPFRVTLKVPDDPHRVRTATMVKDHLEACGMGVVVETRPPEALFAPGPEGDLFGRRFDLALFAWPFTSDPLCDTWLSSQMPGPGRWRRPNMVGFIDNEYDEACQLALKTLPGSSDYASRQAVPQRIFSEQLPVLPLFQHQRATWARSTVIGLSATPSEASELWNLERIDVAR